MAYERGETMKASDGLPETQLLALYARVSDREKQGDNFSIPTQLSMMRESCEALSWSIHTELSEKESAFLDGLSRSELNKALDLARSGTITGLMYFSPDRFTRDMADGVILRRELKKLGIKLFCYRPTVHEVTSDYEIMNILTDWQSQQYVERQREAAMRGLDEKIRLGIYPQGRVPYGYRLEGRKRESHLLFVDEELRIVTAIYDWYYFYNVNCSEIAQRLNDANIPTPSGKAGAAWTYWAVLHILNNEAYSGVWYAYRSRSVGKWKQVKRPKEDWVAIAIPAIIPRHIWEEVQKKIASRNTGSTRENDYLMSCRLRCTCGKSIFGQKKTGDKIRKTYFYYRCHTTRHAKTSCGMPQYQVSDVDTTVWQFALELIQDPERLLRGYRDMQSSQKQEDETITRQIAALEEQIAEQEEQLFSIVDQRNHAKAKALQQLLDERAEDYGTAIDELTARRDALVERKSQVVLTDQQIAEIISEVSELRKMYEALHTIDEEADFSAKRALVELLNLRATLRVDESGQRWVDIRWLRKTYPEKLRAQIKQSAERYAAPRRRG
jgi:site-specific DNA recombinase